MRIIIIISLLFGFINNLLGIDKSPKADSLEKKFLKGIAHSQSYSKSSSSVYYNLSDFKIAEAERYKGLIYNIAYFYGVNPILIMAMIWAESTWNEKAKSSAGAYGLLQILLSTGLDYVPSVTPEQLLQPKYNLRIGCLHLCWVLKQIRDHFPNEDEIEMVAAVWHAGWSNVMKTGGIPDASEGHVKKVKIAYKVYKEHFIPPSSVPNPYPRYN